MVLAEEEVIEEEGGGDGPVAELTETEPDGEPEPDPDTEPEPDADADAADETPADEGEEKEELTVADVPDAVEDTDADVLTARLPMLDTVVQSEEAGAGCADGVEGSP